MPGQLPNRAGVSLKPEYFADVLNADSSKTVHSGLWFEVHPENYMTCGGPRLRGLMDIAEQYAISLHGVSASLGGPDLVPDEYLAQLKSLIARVDPVSISEHAVWSRFEGRYYAELLPLPRTADAMTSLVNGVDHMQNAIGRQILLENPANYLPLISEMDEPDFLVQVAKKTGCGLLIDVNNIFVSANNCGIDASSYIKSVPDELVGEIHIAGFDPDPRLGKRLLIDSHGSAVAEPVWQLLSLTLQHYGPKPVLVERDANLPDFKVLLAERDRADGMIEIDESDMRYVHA